MPSARSHANAGSRGDEQTSGAGGSESRMLSAWATARLVVPVVVCVVCLAVGVGLAGGGTAGPVAVDSTLVQGAGVDAGVTDVAGANAAMRHATGADAGATGTGNTSESTVVGVDAVAFEGTSPQLSRADLQLHSVAVPDVVERDEVLTVEFTVLNVAHEALTDEVLLQVGGATVDSARVTVGPGETVTGTLAFDGVSERFEPGDTADVELDVASTGGPTARAVDVLDTEPAPELRGVETPGRIGPDEALTVEYAVENVGNASAVEDVELVVDGSVLDTDESVTIGAGERVDGTLSVGAEAGGFDDGDTVGVAVELAGPEGVAATDADGVSTTVTDSPNQSIDFGGQNLTATDTVTVGAVRSDGVESTVLITYTEGNDIVVAGLRTGTFDGESVAVTLGDDGGLVGTHTGHVLPRDSLSGEYSPGDNLSTATADSVLARTNATVGVDVNGNGNSATDTTCNGLVNDVTGTGTFGIGDVAAFFGQYGADIVTENPHLFDFDGTGDIGIGDVVALFRKL